MPEDKTRDRRQGYYFNFAKHLSQSKVSIARLSKVSGVSSDTIRQIRSSSRPVNADLIRQVIQGLTQLSSGFRSISFEREFTPDEQLELEITPKASGSIIEGLTALEYAALALTNPKSWDSNDSPSDFRIITSKETYLFLPYIDQILRDTYVRDDFTRDYQNFEIFLRHLFFSAVPMAGEGLISVEPEVIQDFRQNAREDVPKINQILDTLFERRLIEDPLVEPVGLIGVAVLGIVPTSFTKRTNDGDIVYRKVSALLWEYEYLKEDEKELVSLHLKAERLIALVKETVAGANSLMNENKKK